MDEILNLLTKENKIIITDGNHPLLLDQNQGLWIVAKGSVDLFARQTKNDKPIGAQKHIARIKTNECFFDQVKKSAHENIVFTGVGTPGSQVVFCSFDQLKDFFENNKVEKIYQLIKDWVCRLTEAISSDDNHFPQKFTALKPNMDIEVEKDVNIVSALDFVWIKAKNGSFSFMGIKEFPLIESNIFFPLSKNAWLKSIDKASLTTTDFKDQTFDQVISKISFFYEYFYKCFAINFILDEKKQKQQNALSASQDENNVSKILLKISSILKNKKKKTYDFLFSSNPLIAACEAIGNISDIKIKPEICSNTQIKSAISLEDISISSGFQYREVLLTAQWWSKDNGPLLGFLKETNAPVALIPKSSGQYEVFNPITGEQKKVTSDFIDEILPTAYMLYRSFQSKKVKLTKLLSFGLHGVVSDLLIIILMGIGGALLSLLIPILFGVIVDKIIPEASYSQLYQISIFLVICILVVLCFDITKSISMLRLEGKLDASLQTALWDRLIKLPVPFFRKYTAGDLANRSMGIDTIRSILTGVTVGSLLTLTFSVFNLALLFYYDIKLALIAIILTIAGATFTYIMMFLQLRFQRIILNLAGKNQGIVLQLLTGISKLRITGTENRAFNHWAKTYTQKEELKYKAGKISNIMNTFSTIFPLISTLTIFWFFAAKQSGHMSIGSFIAFTTAFASFQNAFIQMSLTLSSTLTIFPIYERMKPILDATPEVDEQKDDPGILNGNIEVNNINFRYDQNGKMILKDVSFKAEQGKFIALVGNSGSGKSTLLRLLLGFEKSKSGTIFYDGQNIDNLDLRKLRKQFGVVLQNGKPLSGDIKSNILGISNLTIDDAWEAASMVGLDEDIKLMPMGMYTVVPAGGETFSGGQRQRLLIARAIVKKPRILFFDEATSALDNRTQTAVSKSLETLKSTRIVIAHRLSTIMNADHIYVLVNGQMVEAGNYDELMTKEKFFYRLAKLQIA